MKIRTMVGEAVCKSIPFTAIYHCNDIFLNSVDNWNPCFIIGSQFVKKIIRYCEISQNPEPMVHSFIYPPSFECYVGWDVI